jgi:hypothetical protein
MNNYAPMFVPGAGKAKASQANDVVGLSSSKLDDYNINTTLFKFVADKKPAPTPVGTVGKCQTMRERILQMSLFPDIYDRNKRVKHPGNVDFGEMD